MKHRHRLQLRKAASKRRSEAQETDEQPHSGARKAKKPGGFIHAARAKHHLGKRSRIGQRPKRFDDGGIVDLSPVAPPILALGSGPPPPPRISDDGTPIPVPAPRANDPTVWNKQIAAQKAAQLKQRVKQLEGKGR